MSGSNSTPDDDWVRLDVGGKLFKTTKFTLSQHPESFLARLVNSGLPSTQDKSGAFLIDRSYEHFDTILNYLRTGSANFDRNETVMKDLLCEADFYNIEPLVDEIRKAMSPVTNRTEIVKIIAHYYNNGKRNGDIYFSEKHDDYEVLRALREKCEIRKSTTEGVYCFSLSPGLPEAILMDVEVILRNFGFVKEFYDANHVKLEGHQSKYSMYVRTVSK